MQSLKNLFRISSIRANNLQILWLCHMHFCWGIASSMIFSLLPIFIVDELGGNSKSFGAIEGMVMFISFMAKLFSGFLIDIFKKTLPMLRVGTILTVISKLSLAFAPNVFFVFLSKSLDRFAKGLRQAPSDAILAILSEKKGLAYALRYTMNISGFLLGSIVTSTIVAMIGKNFRLIFSIAVVPAVFATYILMTKFKENGDEKFENTTQNKWNFKDIKSMPKSYWSFLIFISFLMFNRFSEGFITLRAKEVIPEQVSWFPIFMGIYEICAITFSIIIGQISDKIDKRKIMIFGISLLIIADMFGIFSSDVYTILCIYIFAGLHIGTTQGLIGSMIAKIAPKNLIGPAFAVYYGIEGFILLMSNNLAGFSASFVKSSAAPFFCGMIFSLFAVVYILIWRKNSKNVSL